MNQSGFISLPIMGWAAVAAGVVIVGLGVALKIQSARLDAAQQKAIALEQQVVQWTGVATACSEATKQAKIEADNRAKAAQDALSKVRKAQVAHRKESERLKALMGQKPETACPASEALAAVRKGLK